MASFHHSHLHAYGSSRLTLSTPNKCTASRPKPRQRSTQNQIHPRNQRVPSPPGGRAVQNPQGVGEGGTATQRPQPSLWIFLHECSLMASEFYTSQEMRCFFFFFLFSPYWVNKTRGWKDLQSVSRPAILQVRFLGQWHQHCLDTNANIQLQPRIRPSRVGVQ